MRSKAREFKDPRTWLAVDKNKIWLHVTVSISIPLSAERMVSIRLRKRHIVSEQRNDSIKQFVNSTAMLAFLFPPVVALKCTGPLNRPH